MKKNWEFGKDIILIFIVLEKAYDSVFIQTDKAVYKPGQKMQFRAIVLNAHLKPTVTGALDVYISYSLFICF